MRSRRKNRRGVLLLVCLVMLILFLLSGLTFVLVASQWQTGAEQNAGGGQRANTDWQADIRQVLMELVRGSQNPRSPMKFNSLLGDLYGNDEVKTVFVSGRPMLYDTMLEAAKGNNNYNHHAQFIDFSLKAGNGYTLDPMPGYYNGCVLTVTSGKASTESFRIVNYNLPNPGATDPVGRFIVMPIDSADTPLDSGKNRQFPTAGDLVLINGRPFNGTGLGYVFSGNPGSVSIGPAALHPNLTYAGLTLTQLQGGMDEPYDTWDFNNPWLARFDGASVKPSWHDPTLLAHLGGTISPTAQFRPITQNAPGYAGHPQFTGGNPGFHPINGPWDVDNDGDGIRDSIWMDYGAPARQTADGRLYKPMVAMYVLDLDGRPNLNTAGTITHAGQNSLVPNFESASRETAVPGDGGNYGPALGELAGAAATVSYNVVRGEGAGPAEINPVYVLDPSDHANGRTMLTSILTQRYSKQQEADPSPKPGIYATSGTVFIGTTPISAADTDTDPLSLLTFVNRYGGSGAFGSSDFMGDVMTGVTPLGTPMRFNFSGSGGYLRAAFNPYKQRLRPGYAYWGEDSPFTLAQLEALLRSHDLDQSILPTELTSRVNVSDARTRITTESWSLPVVSNSAPPHLRDLLARAGRHSHHITDLVRAKMAWDYILNEQSVDPHTADAAACANALATVETRVHTLLKGEPDTADPTRLARWGRALSFELLAGRPMNVNRLFGNGRDDSSVLGGQGIVDEPEDADTGTYPENEGYVYSSELGSVLEQIGLAPDSGGPLTTTRFDANNDGIMNSDDANARYLFAKQLYILLMLLAPESGYRALFEPIAPVAPRSAITEAEAKELYAIRVAQFAVNAVDFRDPDGIMTPFEFDIEPFDAGGWQVDGEVGTVDASLDRRVVWGCEAPTLILTEAVAGHNLGIKDTNTDSDGDKYTAEGATANGATQMTDDDDFDPVRMPEGFALFELLCVAKPLSYGIVRQPVVPEDVIVPAETPSRELFDSGGRLQVSDKAGNSPVWRMLISDPHPSTNSLTSRLESKPLTTSIEPHKMNLLGKDDLASNDKMSIDRVVLFTTTALGATPAMIPTERDGEKYYPYMTFQNFNSGTHNGEIFAAPGQHIVVGPRVNTHFGNPTGQRIELARNSVAVYNSSGNLVNPPMDTSAPTNPNTLPPLVVIASTDYPTDWPILGVKNGLNVSEPLPAEYDYWDTTGAGNDPVRLAQAMDHYDPPTLDPTNPLELRYTSPYQDTPRDAASATGNDETPISRLGGVGTRHINNHRTVFLQRLANPLKVFNALTNPYITVDFMPIDLTIFNGEQKEAAEGEYTTPVNRLKFATRQRGRNHHNLTNDPELDRDAYNIWAPAIFDVNEPIEVTRNGTATDIFNFDLNQKLGFININQSGSHGPLPALRPTASASFEPQDPAKPFPMITWNDRPFASAYDLMQVPASSPDRLYYEFSNQLTAGNVNSYDAFMRPYELEQQDYDGTPLVAGSGHRFGHLLNFFSSAGLVRLFDFVGVPSPFVDSHTVLDPRSTELTRYFFHEEHADGTFTDPQLNFANFVNAGIPAPLNDTAGFSPPHNVVSNYREPGRINLNTMTSESQLRALVGHSGRYRTGMWGQFLASRAGTGPSLVNTPFRPGASSPVDVSLLRRSVTNSATPLFAPQPNQNLHRSTSRNSHFAYESIQRLGNLVTSQSNVYAIWMTIGYFEVTPGPISPGHQDGYALGRELGTGTGKINRHRAFFIVDRSIPVAYENGQDHNAAKTIRLQRFIE